jgi:pantoate--beta-alanine ligase
VDDIYDGKVTIATIRFDGLENQMEGNFRPGHFDGEEIVNVFEMNSYQRLFWRKRFPAVTNRKKNGLKTT